MARKASLVCQHLENISRRALEKYQGVIRGYARRLPGVYALYRRGKLYYVGLASDLRNRLKTHLRDDRQHSWDRFSIYLTIGVSHMKEMETLILHISHPPGNSQKGRFSRSENLVRRLRRDLLMRSRAEVISLFEENAQVRHSRRPRVNPGREPSLAAHIKKPFKLRAAYKGRKFHARVLRDGTIRFNGKRYTSPSMAGADAIGRSACNGWTFWQYEHAPGNWLRIDELRK